jgi:1-acyl-sn-glycerol-3-phosphate acyltransferase
MLLYYFRVLSVSIYFFLFCCATLIFVSLRPFNANNTRDALRMLRPAYWIMNLKVHRLNNAPEDSPVVYVINHQDLLDVFFLADIWPKNSSAVGKKELAWVPVFGAAFWLAGNIFINRGDKGKAWQVVEQMADKINQLNRSIVIMPEGTRSQGRGLLPFKKGAFSAAIKAGVPVVPICICSTENINLRDWRPNPALLEFLEPISTQGLTEEDAEELAQKTHDIMKAKIAELDQRVADNNFVAVN